MSANFKSNLKKQLCDICLKPLIQFEKMSIDGRQFHINCFTCPICKKVLKLGEFVNVGEVYYCQPHSRQGRLLLKQNSQTLTPPSSPIAPSDEPYNGVAVADVVLVENTTSPPKTKRRVVFNEEVQVREYIVEEDEDFADIPSYENIIANRNPPPPPAPKTPTYEEPPKPEINNTLASQMLPTTLTSIHTEDSKPKKSVFAFLRKKKGSKTSSTTTTQATLTPTVTVVENPVQVSVAPEPPIKQEVAVVVEKEEGATVEQPETSALTDSQERERRERKREKKEKKAKKSKKKKEGETGEEPTKKSRRKSRGDSSTALSLDGIVINQPPTKPEPEEPKELHEEIPQPEPKEVEQEPPVVEASIDVQSEAIDELPEPIPPEELEKETEEEHNFGLALGHFKTCLTLLGHNTDTLDVKQMLENLLHSIPTNGHTRRHSVIEEETRAIIHKQEQTIRDLKHELAMLKLPQEPDAKQEKMLDDKRKEIELLKSQLSECKAQKQP